MHALHAIVLIVLLALAAITLVAAVYLRDTKAAEEGARSSAQLVAVRHMRDPLYFIDGMRLTSEGEGWGIQAYSGSDLGPRTSGYNPRGFAFDPDAGGVGLRLLEPGYADRLGISQLQLGDVEELVIRSQDQMESAAADAAGMDLREVQPSGIWVTYIELENGVRLRGVATRRARTAADAARPTPDSGDGAFIDLIANTRRTGSPATSVFASARDGVAEWSGASPRPAYDDGSSERLLWSVEVPDHLAEADRRLAAVRSGEPRHCLQTLLGVDALRHAYIGSIDLVMIQTPLMAKVWQRSDRQDLLAQFAAGEMDDMEMILIGFQFAGELLNGRPASFEGMDLRFRSPQGLRFLHIEPQATLRDADVAPDVSGLALSVDGSNVNLAGNLVLTAGNARLASILAGDGYDDMHTFVLSGEVYFSSEDLVRLPNIDDVTFDDDGRATVALTVADPGAASTVVGEHAREISALFQLVRLPSDVPDGGVAEIAVARRDVVWSSGELNFEKSYTVPAPAV